MKILVFGSTGLLGSHITRVLKSQDNHKVYALNRNHFDASTRKLSRDLKDNINAGDVVINCTGVLKPRVGDIGPEKTILINSHFPVMLSQICLEQKARFIHFCSDCVFSGITGGYVETDTCDAQDLYAKTKSITPEYGTIMRVSFVGSEPRQYPIGLLSKLKELPPHSTVTGYTNCLWNGMTTLQLAKFVRNMINNHEDWIGLRHVFSPDCISKYDLCCMINEIYRLRLNIVKKSAEHVSGSPIPTETGMLDRTLSTIYDQIKLPSIQNQLIEMRGYDELSC